MRLWTAQSEQAYTNYLNIGRFIADGCEIENQRKYSYTWLVNEMVKRIGSPPFEVEYPMWAWYQWQGKKSITDKYVDKYRNRNYRIIVFNVGNEEVLLSDSILWKIPLNQQLIYLFEDEFIDFELKLSDLSQEEQQKFMDKNWERIFDLNSPNPYCKKQNQSIQATMWEIRKEQIISIEKVE